MSKMKKHCKKLLAIAACASVMFTVTSCGELTHYFADGKELDEFLKKVAQKEEADFQDEVEHSKDDLMRIKSSKDLLKFKKRVENGEIALGAVLTKDIDMSDICGETIGNWEPITEYAGTFDGDNHSIKNLYINNNTDEYTGLFGRALEDSLIKNVTMEDFQITSEKTSGSLAGSSRGTVENCHSDGQLTATSKVSGGLCGIGEIMINCSNRGTVNGVETTVGGVVGEMRGTIENCWNEGSIESTGNYVGGVIGSLTEDINHGKLPVFATDCYNTGKVTNTAICAGGVIGHAHNFVINRCYNLGEVSALAGAGGIVATASSERKADKQSVIENCYNKGCIAAINWTGMFKDGSNIVTKQTAGGIADVMDGCIVNCYNEGDLSVSAENALEGSVHGIGSATFVTNSYAHGSLTAADDSMKIGIGYTSTSQTNPSTFYLEGLENDTPGSPEAFFTDGSLLLALQSFSPDGLEDDYYPLELSSWVQGENGIPRFDWE